MATLIEDPAGSGLYRFVADPSPEYPGTEGWHSLSSARADWTDAPKEDSLLSTLLDAAKDQCIARAPKIAEGQAIPARYRLAQLMQARALWQSGKASPQGEMGEGGYTVAVFPMDWTVVALLRPRNGTPVVA